MEMEIPFCDLPRQLYDGPQLGHDREVNLVARRMITHYPMALGTLWALNLLAEFNSCL